MEPAYRTVDHLRKIKDSVSITPLSSVQYNLYLYFSLRNELKRLTCLCVQCVQYTVQLCSRFHSEWTEYPPHIYANMTRYDIIILMGSNHMNLNNPPHCISNRIKLLLFFLIHVNNSQFYSHDWSRLLLIQIGRAHTFCRIRSSFPCSYQMRPHARATWVCGYSSFISSFVNMWIH